MRWAAPALLLAGAVFAAEPPHEFRCNDVGTQQELNACARDALEEADRKLNETYQALIRKERDNPAYIAGLRKAQKAWIAFRDAEVAANFACEERYRGNCWGSMYPMSLAYFKAKLTDERRIRLQEILEKGRETT